MNESNSSLKIMTHRDYFDLFQKDERYRKYVTRLVTVGCNYMFEFTIESAFINCLQTAYAEWIQKSIGEKPPPEEPLSIRNARILLEALRRVCCAKWGIVITGIDAEASAEAIRLQSLLQ
jgi:hypothetical protein